MSALEKMPGHPRLYRRDAVYYHRAAVPKDIASTYPKREETFSLKTKDRQEALRLVRIAAVEVDRRFDEHRAKVAKMSEPMLVELTASQISELKAGFYRHLLALDEDARLEGFASEADRAEDDASDPRPTFDEFVAATEDTDAITRRLLARGEQFAPMRSLAESWLQSETVNLRLAPESPSWPRVLRALQEAWVLANNDFRKRNHGDVIETPAPQMQSLASATPLLSAAAAAWASEKAKGAWSKKAEDDNRKWLAAFVEAMGDRPLTAYTKADGRDYKAVLMHLPANWRKLPSTRDLSIRGAAEANAKLGLAKMSVANINKAMNRLVGFWNWASEHYDDVPPCPVAKMQLAETVRAKDKKNPLSEEQLKALFTSPVYSGSRSERFASQSGDFVMSGTWKYWAPILGLFTGARANELCRLRPQDVRHRDGISYFEIKADDTGEGVKSVAGNRIVPLHRELLRLGFLELVEDRRKAGDDWVLTGLRVDAFGYRSDALSDFFSNYLKALEIKTAKTSFHSLRHNFKDACRFAEIDRGVAEALSGREEDGTGGGYGSGEYSLRQLNESLQRISYPFLSLGGLPTYSARSA